MCMWLGNSPLGSSPGDGGDGKEAEDGKLHFVDFFLTWYKLVYLLLFFQQRRRAVLYLEQRS